MAAAADHFSVQCLQKMRGGPSPPSALGAVTTPEGKWRCDVCGDLSSRSSTRCSICHHTNAHLPNAHPARLAAVPSSELLAAAVARPLEAGAAALSRKRGIPSGAADCQPVPAAAVRRAARALRAEAAQPPRSLPPLVCRAIGVLGRASTPWFQRLRSEQGTLSPFSFRQVLWWRYTSGGAAASTRLSLSLSLSLSATAA